MDDLVNILDFQNISKKNIPKMAYDYINGGSNDELTLSRNVMAFRNILLKQKILVDVSKIKSSTTVFNSSIDNPLLLGAVSLHKLSHPMGEIATAQAAEALNTIMLLSSLSSTSLEDVSSASNSDKWFQLYWNKDRTLTKDLVHRVNGSKYKAIALTVDAPVLGHREKDVYNKFTLPDDIYLENFRKYAQGKLPVPQQSGSGLAQYVGHKTEDSITWSDLDWLKSNTNLPIIIKGLQTYEDAKLALKHEIQGIIVSNHGGRQLDGSLSSIECLPRVVDAVDDQIDILLDSGIRRGSDIVKSIALGAKAVLIGRPYIWGLGAFGKDGIIGVYNILIKEFLTTMKLIGCNDINKLDHSFLEDHSIPNFS
tara:strand:+ start:185 stop:1285 length:1101 start_codon:yes stop_codon:yes gene_type:complete